MKLYEGTAEEMPEAAPEPILPYPKSTNNDGFSSSSSSTTLTLESLANQMKMMQQTQDWLSEQKEQEMKTLRTKVESLQKELMEKKVEIALLKEKLNQQEIVMKKELKIARLRNKSERGSSSNNKSDNKKNKANKEIHIQELHVQVGATPSQQGGEQQIIIDPQSAVKVNMKGTEEQGITKNNSNNNNSNREFTFMPPGATTNNNDTKEQFEEEEENKWMAQKIPPKSNGNNYNNNEIQFNPTGNTNNNTKQIEPNEIRFDGGAGLNIGGTGLPSKKTIGEKIGPRGSIPLDIDHQDEGNVPIDEDVTIGTMDQQYFSGNNKRFDPDNKSGTNFPMHNNNHEDERSIGGKSLDNTVASSTYGEDRQKVVNQTLLDPYGDGGSYSGVVLRTTGMPHGLGRMVYEDDGRTYEGDWRHGRWHGFGRATFANGDSYEGEYRFDQRHGRGKYSWNDGRVYDGEFAEDKRHGKGTFVWPDGATYVGDFHQGQREGHGRYTFSDGGYYSGSWVDGRYEGFGECHWEDGRKYKGEWRAGMAHGQGVETYPDGRVRHDGQWIDDEPIRYNR